MGIKAIHSVDFVISHFPGSKQTNIRLCSVFAGSSS